MSKLAIRLSDDLADCPRVLELGSMLGNSLMAAPGPIRVGVEPHLPYIRKSKYHDKIIFINCYASQAVSLFLPGQFDAILLIDFPEHLEKEEAIRIVECCKDIASKKIIWFSPEGVHPQNKDVLRLGADKLQTHRSSWTWEEVNDLGFEAEVWKDFHKRDTPNYPDAIYGVWYK